MENQREVVSSTSSTYSRNYLEEMNTTVMKSSLHLFDKSYRAKQSFNKFKEHLAKFQNIKHDGNLTLQKLHVRAKNKSKKNLEFQQIQRAFSEISKYKT